jgi:hypothetical protein
MALSRTGSGVVLVIAMLSQMTPATANSSLGKLKLLASWSAFFFHLKTGSMSTIVLAERLWKDFKEPAAFKHISVDNYRCPWVVGIHLLCSCLSLI